MNRDTENYNLLKSRGWSQDNIATALGVTRPTVKKLSVGSRVLNELASERLSVLSDIEGSFSMFQRNALVHYLAEHVTRPAYRNLANRG